MTRDRQDEWTASRSLRALGGGVMEGDNVQSTTVALTINNIRSGNAWRF